MQKLEKILANSKFQHSLRLTDEGENLRDLEKNCIWLECLEHSLRGMGMFQMVYIIQKYYFKSDSLVTQHSLVAKSFKEGRVKSKLRSKYFLQKTLFYLVIIYTFISSDIQ